MFGRVVKFDWNVWNIQKNEIKHGVSSREAESAFSDVDQVVFTDIKHSSYIERRYTFYGKSIKDRVLMIGFTIRDKKFRIITARPASKKERIVYEEAKKNI